MSYDLEIALSRKPTFENIAEFVSSQKGIEASGRLEGGKGNVIVRRTGKVKASPGFTVDGPFQIEEEDLPDELMAFVLAPRWLIQVSVPAASNDKDLSTALALGRALAKVCDGAVYDPQEDKVVFPKGTPKRYKAPAEEQRIRLVNCEWYLPPARFEVTTASELLRLIRRLCPEAAPTRFGQYEPLQHRIEKGNDQPFLDSWKEAAAVDIGDSFFWKAKSPCYGGSVFFPDWRNEDRPKGVARRINLSMDFDGRALHGDSRWTETVIALFLELSRKLQAYYAATYVQREVIAKRGIWLDGRSEDISLPGGQWWTGLPPIPTWLSWFGKPYHSLVKGVSGGFQEYPEGLFLRLGSEPMDRDQLTGKFPPIPKELQTVVEGSPREGRVFKPASVMPEIADVKRPESDLTSFEVTGI